MKTWDDYKEYVKKTDKEAAKDIEEAEMISTVVSSIIKQRNNKGLSQRELAKLCNLPQSSIARIESCKTTPNLSTLVNIFEHLGLKFKVTTDDDADLDLNTAL